jgi:hypothetical protein
LAFFSILSSLSHVIVIDEVGSSIYTIATNKHSISVLSIDTCWLLQIHFLLVFVAVLSVDVHEVLLAIIFHRGCPFVHLIRRLLWLLTCFCISIIDMLLGIYIVLDCTFLQYNLFIPSNFIHITGWPWLLLLLHNMLSTIKTV